MNSYLSEPRCGNAKRIWRGLIAGGVQVHELHYNPNCWMRALLEGWGTWACTATLPHETGFDEYWCGMLDDGMVYLELSVAPYQRIFFRGGYNEHS